MSEDEKQTTLNNIEYLLKNDIGVAVRMNVGLHNGDDVLLLINELKERFGNYNKFSAYANELFIGEGDPPLELTDEETEIVFNNVKRAFELLDSVGIHHKEENLRSFKLGHCMADSGFCKLITPDGNLSPCEHHAYSELCGNIYDGITDYEKLGTWKESAKTKPECDTCFNYPKCVLIKKCPTNKFCEKPQRMLMSYNIESKMLSIYNKYKESK